MGTWPVVKHQDGRDGRGGVGSGRRHLACATRWRRDDGAWERLQGSEKSLVSWCLKTHGACGAHLRTHRRASRRASGLIAGAQSRAWPAPRTARVSGSPSPVVCWARSPTAWGIRALAAR
jgi:hypothetical protein